MQIHTAFANARNYGGTVIPYKQVFFQWHEVPQDRPGACWGLSLLWIRETRKGKSFLDAIGDDIDPPVSREALIDFHRNPDQHPAPDVQKMATFRKQVDTRHAAGHITNVLNGVARQSLADARLKQNEILHAMGVLPKIDEKIAAKAVSGEHFRFDQSGSGPGRPREELYPIVIKNTAEAITEKVNSWVLIHRTDHTMAAHVAANQVRFFDPNGGQVTFSTNVKFQDWFKECWGKVDEYAKTYSCIVEYYAA